MTYYARKSPRIPDFDYSSDHYYFVTICTHNRRCIFGKPNQLNRWGEIVQRQLLQLPEHYAQVKVDKYVVMPNHIHMILVIEDGYLMKNESVGNVKNANYTMMLMGQDNQYTPILMSNELTNSMFTRLYLYGGAGQDIFEQVHSDQGVLLFKVNFDKTAAGS